MFTIDREDLQTFSKIGKALWVDPEYSEKFTSETLAAVTLLDLTSDRALEKASSALLDCAKRRGGASNAWVNSHFLSQSFFRLSPEERFVLVGLHSGRWSYARLSRILGMSSEEVQELSWQARLQMSSVGAYPAGPGATSFNCPEYNPRHPWTQRFLDEEFSSKREVFFLQNHLLVCSSCERTLARCRDIYFKVDKEISQITEDSDFMRSLERIASQSSLQKYPSERSFKESLAIFIRRPEAKLMILALLVLFLFRFLSFFQ